MLTQSEIQAFLDTQLAEGPGTDFEKGVHEALNWALGNATAPPLP